MQYGIDIIKNIYRRKRASRIFLFIGKVWLNDTQYFTNVPLIAWEFYIGGYQPAQKWLKDRQGRTLDHSDIKHYMNIIAALSLTNELMQQIDDINVVG